MIAKGFCSHWPHRHCSYAVLQDCPPVSVSVKVRYVCQSAHTVSLVIISNYRLNHSIDGLKKKKKIEHPHGSLIPGISYFPPPHFSNHCEEFLMVRRSDAFPYLCLIKKIKCMVDRVRLIASNSRFYRRAQSVFLCPSYFNSA